MRSEPSRDMDVTPHDAEAILRLLGAQATQAPAPPRSPPRTVAANPLAEHPAAPAYRTRDTFADKTVRSLIESMPDALVLVDPLGRIAVVNGQTAAMFEYTRDELLGSLVEVLLPERYRERHVRSRTGFFADMRIRPMGAGLDLYGRRKSGEEFPVEISLSYIESKSGPLALAIIRDVSERQRGEKLLRNAEARFRNLVEGIPAICFIAGYQDTQGEIYVSPQIEKVLGFTQQEWLGDPILWYTRLHPEDRERWHQEFSKTCSEGKFFAADYRFLARDNSVVWIHGEARVIRDEAGNPLYLHGIAFDITQQKEAEEIRRRAHAQLEQLVNERTTEVDARKRTQAKLEAILKEREALLKEIHHRVKNNLQITSSLLKLQSRSVSDPASVEVLREAQNRIRLMALLHEKLYRTEDLAHIDFRAYVAELTSYLFRTYSVAKTRVSLQLQIDTFFFDIDTAIPCGLVINELVTNSLKYAFPQNKTGAIFIAMRRDGAGHIVLEVGDDGVGLPADFDMTTSSSLGLQLVRTMAEQLGGAVELPDGAQHGTSIRVRFPDNTSGKEAGS